MLMHLIMSIKSSSEMLKIGLSSSRRRSRGGSAASRPVLKSIILLLFFFILLHWGSSVRPSVRITCKSATNGLLHSTESPSSNESSSPRDLVNLTSLQGRGIVHDHQLCHDGQIAKLYSERNCGGNCFFQKMKQILASACKIEILHIWVDLPTPLVFLFKKRVSG